MKTERNQINKIKNEKGDKTIDTAEIPKKKKKSEYQRKAYAGWSSLHYVQGLYMFSWSIFAWAPS